jgi:UDP-N-acetylglucosamine acyltransferase
VIHASALVDPRARLGRAVTVGAFSVVGPDVALDDAVELGHHVVLEGRLEVGARARIGHGSVIGGAPQDLKFEPETRSGVRIGSGTVIREHVTIHRATAADGWTEVGPDCLLMGGSHVAHDCRLGAGVILINYAGLSGHCEIGDRATIGGLTGLHPFTRVGEHAYVGGVSKVASDVPPYMLVDGIPATARGVNVIGLRRAGMPPRDRRALQHAYRILYRSGLAPHRALERIRDELGDHGPVQQLIGFVVASRRGICGPPRGITEDDGGSAADAARRVGHGAEAAANAADDTERMP